MQIKIIIAYKFITNFQNHKIMTRTITEINRDYRIKVFGFLDGKKINTLVGWSGLLNIIGAELAEKFVERAYASGMDYTHCKLRRGLKVSFYNK